MVETTFDECNQLIFQAAEDTGLLFNVLRKQYHAQVKLSWEKNMWNLYEKYFPRYRAEEVDRCWEDFKTHGIMEFSTETCWPTFMEAYDDNAMVFLRTKLNLDRVLTEKETIAQQSKSFASHKKKIMMLNKEAVFNRFQSVSILTGECINEDVGLRAIIATPGLTNLFQERLKLDDDTIIGLAKVESFHSVTQEFTKEYDEKEVTDSLEESLETAHEEAQAMKTATKTAAKTLKPEQVAKAASSTKTKVVKLANMSKEPVKSSTTLPPPTTSDWSTTSEPKEPLADSLVAVKYKLIEVMNAVAKPKGHTISEKKFPWATMGATLADLGYAFYGWPLNCPLPTQTCNKGNSIKDLGVRNARTLLAALQNEQLWLVARPTQDLVESKIPVITTVSPAREAHLLKRVENVESDNHEEDEEVSESEIEELLKVQGCRSQSKGKGKCKESSTPAVKAPAPVAKGRAAHLKSGPAPSSKPSHHTSFLQQSTPAVPAQAVPKSQAPPTIVSSTTATTGGGGTCSHLAVPTPAPPTAAGPHHPSIPPPNPLMGHISQAPPLTTVCASQQPLPTSTSGGNMGSSHPTAKEGGAITTLPPPPHPPASTAAPSAPSPTGAKPVRTHRSGLDILNSFPASALGNSSRTVDSASVQHREQPPNSTPVDRTRGQSHG
ncbi:hypothetical protein DXG01_003188 [Tephrocybe rancida]|nr:hypothetical protein DXG01_003188 [Tephrocybe rancida]